MAEQRELADGYEYTSVGINFQSLSAPVVIEKCNGIVVGCWFAQDAPEKCFRPAVEPPAKPAPRFKVGDRVRVTGAPRYGKCGTVSEYSNPERTYPYRVEVDAHGKSLYAEDELEPAPPEPKFKVGDRVLTAGGFVSQVVSYRPGAVCPYRIRSEATGSLYWNSEESLSPGVEQPESVPEGYEWTGEVREPRNEEWYISMLSGNALLCDEEDNVEDSERYILRKLPAEPKFKKDDRVIFDLFGEDVAGYVADPEPDGEHELIGIRREGVLYSRRQSEVRLAPEPMTFGQWMTKKHPSVVLDSTMWHAMDLAWTVATEQARRED